MHQPSPGGQSSCSSEPSPLGSAANNDSGVEMAAHSGGSLGDLSTLDDPSHLAEPFGFEDPRVGGVVAAVATAGLRLRKQLGGSCRRLEYLKKEKLETARDSCRWTTDPAPLGLGTKLPPILAYGSPLECPGMGGSPGSVPGSGFGDLTSAKMTLMLGNLSERRDSTSSTLSSVYTLSRRSSGISPCYSSRRSSQASQSGGANRPSNVSSADSYDPISADISRRSSQASQLGGGSLTSLSLTPAQHYRLRAKYAAATGGAPPTPLSYTDRNTHLTSCADFQQFAADATSPRQRSSYARHCMMPHELPSNIPRRASEPARRAAVDPAGPPQMQRYNSLGTLSRRARPRPPPATDRQHLSQQTCIRPDQFRYPHSLQPPGFSENATMEAMADSIPEEDLVLRFKTDNGDRLSDQDSRQHSYFRRRTAVVDLEASSMSPLRSDSGANFSAQWNKSGSGIKRHPELHLGRNLAVLQQNQNFGPFRNNLEFPQQLNAEPKENCFQLSSNLNEAIRSQFRFIQGTGLYDDNGNATCPPCDITAGINGLSCKREPVDAHFTDTGFHPVQVKTENRGGSILSSDQQNCKIPQQNQSHVQPRPPAEPKPLNRHLSRPKTPLQTQHPSGFIGLQQGDNSEDNSLFYMGQIQVFESNGNLDVPLFDNDVVSPDSEQAQIDFDSMLDDGDHSSLMSGTMSPGLLQSLSRSSSRLATPSNSVTLPPVTVGVGNMAVGDMSSLLSALAEESKFLNLIS